MIAVVSSKARIAKVLDVNSLQPNPAATVWILGGVALKPGLVEALLPDINADAWIATAPPLRRAARFYPIV